MLNIHLSIPLLVLAVFLILFSFGIKKIDDRWYVKAIADQAASVAFWLLAIQLGSFVLLERIFGKGYSHIFFPYILAILVVIWAAFRSSKGYFFKIVILHIIAATLLFPVMLMGSIYFNCRIYAICDF